MERAAPGPLFRALTASLVDTTPARGYIAVLTRFPKMKTPDSPMASLNDIRTTFLDYFRRNGHEIVDSSPLVPRNDPTLMFTNSGMVQFKNLFTGVEHRDYVRAATSQKCVRAGGKHNDLDNVGYTARHHTFFEMLGNFSFGDYFKENAIPFAWELLTKDFGIDKSKLLVTVYHTDDEAAEIWKKVAGLPDEKIIRIPTNDNFWMMGPRVPAAPAPRSSMTTAHDLGRPAGHPGRGRRPVHRDLEPRLHAVRAVRGRLAPGPRAQSIDTGMGLERIGALLQGKHDNYDTDLMRSLIEASAMPRRRSRRAEERASPGDRGPPALGLLPDRRRGDAVERGARLCPAPDHAPRDAACASPLGVQDPLMYRLVPALVAQMGQAYPELGRAQALITETLKLEEERFRTTLDRGLKLLDDELAKLPEGAALAGRGGVQAL
jgi:alanyl-tRNA synthetase